MDNEYDEVNECNSAVNRGRVSGWYESRVPMCCCSMYICIKCMKSNYRQSHDYHMTGTWPEHSSCTCICIYLTFIQSILTPEQIQIYAAQIAWTYCRIHTVTHTHTHTHSVIWLSHDWRIHTLIIHTYMKVPHYWHHASDQMMVPVTLAQRNLPIVVSVQYALYKEDKTATCLNTYM